MSPGIHYNTIKIASIITKEGDWPFYLNTEPTVMIKTLEMTISLAPKPVAWGYAFERALEAHSSG